MSLPSSDPFLISAPVNDPFWTLLPVITIPAVAPPPSATNNATIATIIAGEGRFRFNRLRAFTAYLLVPQSGQTILDEHGRPVGTKVEGPKRTTGA